MRVEIGMAELYLGDCLEVLPSLGGIDAVVTDPPYNVGIAYDNHDDRMKSRDYLRWLQQRFEACAAAGATQILWFWQGIRVANGQARACLPRGWSIHHLCAWHKREFAGDLMKGNHPAYAWEPIVWAARPGGAAYGGLKGGHSARDCIVANQSRHDGRFDHPCYKTLAVVRAAVQWIKADVIADPFMGSGTTGVAAVQAGRRFLGIEKSPRYFFTACQRLEQAQRQVRLIP